MSAVSASASPAPSRSASPSRDAGPAHKRHALLQRPLYAFQLPPTLVRSIKLRSIDVEPIAPPAEASGDSLVQHDGRPAAPSHATSTPSNSLSCTLCPSNPTFPTSAHQRAHFRSEWHRFNLQLMLRGAGGSTPNSGTANPEAARSVGALVDEKGWETLLNDLGEPTDEEDGGHTTDDDARSASHGISSASQDIVSAVLAKLHIGQSKTGATGAPETEAEDDDEELEVGPDGRPRRGVTAKSALLWYATPQSNAGLEDRVYIEQTQLGVYRTVFPDVHAKSVEHLRGQKDAAQWHLDALRTCQLAALRRPAARHGGPSAWKGKRLKGMEEAAGMLGFNFLEGENYLGGLALKRDKGSRNAADASEDEDESDGESDSSSSSSSSSDDEAPSTSAGSSLSRSLEPPIRTWTILLFGGGHFSIAVLALNPYIAPRAASRNRPLPEQGSDEEIVGEDRSIIVLAHKAFHRYTTRRKQGGAQSLQDATGKFAKSAGAQLRRYGEAALAEEIKELLSLSGYRKLIGESERVYIRANARAARGILWSWPGSDRPSPLDEPRSDGRMRTIPFSTRSKATVGECLRVFAELSRVKVSRRTEAELDEEDEAYRQSLAGSAAAREELKKRREKERMEREANLRRLQEDAKRKRRGEQALSKDEKKQRERFERMIEMARRGRVDTLVNLLEKHGSSLLPGTSGDFSIDATLPDWWRSREVRPSARRSDLALVPSTVLQVAAEAAQEDVLRWLLVEKKADPTIGVQRPPKTPRDATATTEQHGASEASPDAGGTAWPHRAAYDLLPPGASARGARNVFRRLYAQQPDWWDWEGGARVLDGKLTEVMEGNQNRRKANMRDKARQREREREAREAASAAASPIPESQPEPPTAPVQAPSSALKNRLGGGGASGPPMPRGFAEARDKLEGVTPEMRMRIEREKRARAAEERMKKLQQR
ncbi:unnamed protein product [Parajaminaea phylloscopi]